MTYVSTVISGNASTPKSAQMPAPSYAFTTSPSNITSPSSVPTSLNDVSISTEDFSQLRKGGTVL